MIVIAEIIGSCFLIASAVYGGLWLASKFKKGLEAESDVENPTKEG
jgi:hypothetical protein